MSRVSDIRPLEVRRQEWLNHYPDKFLACRASHDWPRMRPGSKLTGTRLEPWHDPDGIRNGCYYLEQRCRSCGRVRWRITGPPNAFYSGATQWKYEDPKGYGTPPGLGIKRAEYMDLFFDRLLTGDQDFRQELEAREEETRKESQ